MDFNPEIKNRFFEILSSRPNANKLINNLMNNGELILFGGCIRDYFENYFNVLPRDFDIVIDNIDIDIESILLNVDCNYRINKFGGFKIYVDGLTFDMWDIQNTWAFKTEKVEYISSKDLNKTVFLNIDSLHYSLNSCFLLDEGFNKAFKRKEIDIVLSENPYPELNIAKAIRYKSKYKLKFSEDLNHYFQNWINNQENKITALNRIKKIVYKRYQSIPVEDLDNEINKIKDEYALNLN
ncbi:hypothetical protein [Aquisalibacillus elongatus]|uniref:Poly A polymerase head domain-containing protein n=1 Tax=Aquisalibacillus elongatus TaxID=485577 RepID=A0A3N5BRB7_9BACI|nr:hypothetical protein [Aquisalibacillus elongatus]RPF50052.1 hypothetical protein EDC24_2868 [Aquisalibacillus elongatus]